MITDVAIVPGTLALLPEYVGRVDPIPALRAAAQHCVDAVVVDADRVIVITAADADARHSRRPVGERIATHLLQQNVGREPARVAVVPVHAPLEMTQEIAAVLGGVVDPRAPRTALVVVADGSATRTEKAPGHLHPRSHEFDESLLAAVRDADVRALLHLDPALAAEVMALGRAPLQVMAAALGESTAYRCVDFVIDDSFGVLHVVARLSRADTPAQPRSPRAPSREQ